MFKVIVFILALIMSLSAHSVELNIYVSANGNDSSGNGTTTNPYKTVTRALTDVNDADSNTYNIVLKYVNGSSIDFHTVGSTLTLYKWENLSGTELGPINIFSEDKMVTVNTKSLNLIDVRYINFHNINFNCLQLDCLQLKSADYISIVRNKIDCIDQRTGGASGGGVIWVGTQINLSIEALETQFETDFETGDVEARNALSSNNILVKENFINYTDSVSPNLKDHAIYISNGSREVHLIGNTITGNTGSVVSFNHGYMENHTMEKNFIYADNSVFDETHAVRMGYEGKNLYEIPYINNILIKYNYLDVSQDRIYVGNKGGICDAQSNLLITSWYRFKKEVCEIQGNDYYNRGNYKSNGGTSVAHDPLWLNYLPGQVSNRMISGDFNGDGFENEFVAFYEAGMTSTDLHVFESKVTPFKHIAYSGSSGWWSSNGYWPSRVQGIASGDFDNDGQNDDLVALYHNGATSSSVHLWTGQGNTFSWEGSKWSVGSGYDASKAFNRFVSGDFDGDGIKDDLAAFYANSGSSSTIHVWIGNGSSFSYQGGSGWFGSGGICWAK